MEEHREHVKVQQQLMNKKDGGGGGGGGGGGRMGGNMGGRGSHTPGGGRNSQTHDEGWNMVPISKNRPIDTTRLSKITKVTSTSYTQGFTLSLIHFLKSSFCFLLTLVSVFKYSGSFGV